MQERDQIKSGGALGLLQVYTGPGKGKTTAAVGLAARAAAHGLKVTFIQFAKPDSSAEFDSLKKLGVYCMQFGAQGWIKKGGDNTEHAVEAQKGWRLALTYLKGDETTDILILDEINVILSAGLLKTAGVMEVLLNRFHGLEVVCTGREAPPELVMAADLVTEMLDIKHYFQQGVEARLGIEY
ncbi:AAA family ATPase [candidate division WOR-3 bacterium]|uniref:AAA family ATPase n=1 Tax=candidate division WOR-3 bacterium TaxID=2052148 RepID=A0A9D5K8K2_UNCW3|nr:AAA family ATPase [candidate division WOR-3 bacterium]MBD3363610.1 AAA family ATPase [candidate division WOR-3 bacterium]